MIKVSGTLLALSILCLYPLSGCDCGGGRNVTPDRPLLGEYSLSGSETPGEYLPTPEGANDKEAELAVEFSVIAVKTTSSQYLFLKNTGS
ncbi:MAG: hypothetical protein GYA21_18565, partial [Myxococcales bacterium]|nr:hypothetical protein [Myxococcales bacterium]